MGGMLFQSEPCQFFHRTFEFMHWLHSRFTWTPGAHVSGFCHVFMLCICFVLWLWCFCAAAWMPCMRILRVKNQCPTVDVVLWKLHYSIAEGCLLKVSWVLKNIRDVGVDTSDLPGPKLGCLHVLRCNPCCQAWAFEVVFGMLHMHLRVTKVSYRAYGERIRLITMGSHGSPDTFFQTLNGHIFQIGQKKW